MRTHRVVASLCFGAVAVGATILTAQSAISPQSTSPPLFRSGVAVLRLDASVVDDSGRAIGDMTAGDFQVTVDGRPRKVVFARFTGATEGSSPARAVAAAVPSYAVSTRSVGGRAIALMVDLESIRAGSERPLLDTAAQLVEKLRPIDAAAVVPLPGQSVDLTRDHRRIADAIRNLRGTSQVPTYRYFFTLDEAVGFERRDKRVIAEVVERECARDVETARAAMGFGPTCPPQLERDTRDRLNVERLHVEMVLTNLVKVANQLKTVQAPVTIVLVSGGLGFEQESLGRFQQVESALKEAGIAIATVQVDQPAGDASVSRQIQATFYSTSDRQSGLANVATMSGGVFYSGVGTAKGVFERLRTELTEAYELGVEAEPQDLDGKPHEVRVTSTRKATVRARRFVAAAVPAADWATRMANLVKQPVDVGDLPIALAAHSTRGEEATTLKVMIRAEVGHGVATTAPVRYVAVVIGAGEAVVMNVTGTTASDGGVLLSTQLAPGRYRVRLAALDGSGREGILEMPIVAGIRRAGGFQLSDVIVGTLSEDSLKPSIYASAGETLIPTLELSTDDSARFARTNVGFELRRGGGDEVVVTGEGRLEQTAYDRQQIARGSVSTSTLQPGEYTLSAIVKLDGQPAGRVSRTFILEPATSRPAPVIESPPVATSATRETPAPSRIADPTLEEIVHKAAAYVASYGEQMSAVVAVEKYTQHVNPIGGTSTPPRELVAEFALVKGGGPVPWTGYRDVLEVNGEPVHDRRDRIVKILTDSANPLEEAGRLTAESARFNVGPVIRNFNLPTTALFFFHQLNMSRFTFTRKGAKKIDGIDTLEIAFRETQRPTLITTRDGKDVPCEGILWVLPDDGTIVRTRLQLKGFADALSMPQGRTPGLRAPPQSSGSITTLESTAEIEVTYHRDDKLGMWLPARMTEEYQGVIPRLNNPPVLGMSRSNATYSEYKRFGTSTTVIGPKK